MDHQCGVRRVASWRAGDPAGDLAGVQVEGDVAGTGGKFVAGPPGHSDGGDAIARPNGCDGVDAGVAGGINLDFEP